MAGDRWLPYVVAVMSVVAALLLVRLLPILEPAAFLLLYAAVILTAWVGGMKPGVLAIGLFALAAGYLKVQPLDGLQSITDLVQVATFVLVSLAITWLCSRLQAVKRECKISLNQLQESKTLILSDRQQNEAALRESERRFRRLVESNMFGVAFGDFVDSIHYANDCFLNLIGYSREELLAGQIRWTELTPPEFSHLDVAAAAELRQRGVATPFEKEYIHKDGRRIPILVGGALLQEPFDQQQEVIGFFVDLTERKQAEAALQETNQTLQAMIHASPLAIISLDLEGNVKLWCSAAERLFGWTEAEVLGRPVPFVSPEHQQEFQDLHQVKLAGGSLCEVEVCRHCKDGSAIDVAIWGAPIYDTQGKITATMAVIADVSERKQAEEARLLLAAIVETSQDAIMGFTLEGKIISWNWSAAKIFGYSASEVQGRNVLILVPPDRHYESTEIFAALRRGESITSFETVRLKKDGSLIDVSIAVSPIKNSKGVLIGVSATLRDTTELRRSQQALQEHNQRLNLLSEAASALLSTRQPLTLMSSLFQKLATCLDLHYYFNFLVDEENPSRLRLTSYAGISDETAQTVQSIELGQDLCGMVALDRRQCVINHVQESTAAHVQTIRSMGITAYAGQPLVAQGRLLGTLAFASRSRTHFTPEEAALLQTTSDQVAVALERSDLLASLQRRTDQLLQANQIKDEFLAILSHELRTPLNSILGWAKLLRSHSHSQATVDRALKTIERNAQLQTQLIGDLLDVSRILQGKFSLSVQAVNLATVCTAAIETVRLSAEAKSIQIQPVLAPITVFGDATRLQQVVWNLLSNAIKFTPPSGRIDLSLTHTSDRAQLQVRDTGKGITSDFLPYVFDTFRQADSATTRKFGGLGLGLAIVRQIVELHGGTVRVESVGEDQGSTFTIQMPLKADADR